MKWSAPLGLVLAVFPVCAQEPPQATSRTLVGELVRIDLSRPSVTLKVAEKPPREYELPVDAETRYVSQGRALRLVDLRPGERAVAVLREDGRGGRRVTLLKLGASAYAAPLSAPSKPPRP